MSDTIQVGDLSIAYDFSGPEDAPLVVLSHSLAADKSMWAPQIPVLTDRYRVLAYDHRGHGETEAAPAPYTMEQLAGDAAGLIEALDVAPVLFVGLSLGGMVGQILGGAHPKTVSALVLCDTASIMPTDIWEERINGARAQGMAALAQPTSERWFTAPFHEREPDIVEGIKDGIRATPIEGYIGCSEAIRDMDLREVRKRIAVPTLVMVGADDPATTPDAARDIVSAVPGAELVIIEEAAHLSNVEQPAAFNDALMEFLGRVRS